MQYEIEVGARRRVVKVDRKADRFHVTLDGRTWVVDARRLDERTLSLLLASDEAGVPSRRAEAALVAQGTSGAFLVHVDGHQVPVQVRNGSLARRGRGGAAGGGSGPQKVTAPMPGKVVRVLVGPGDEVTAKQGLVVVEAMKMENELRAARDGRVRDVLAAEGQSVDAGAVLVIVE